ncbi:MAG: hypothetical protein RBU30_27080, partial [Polyangia bacterium]|nr:hypothetical protein [Polyangia bacterium]
MSSVLSFRSIRSSCVLALGVLAASGLGSSCDTLKGPVLTMTADKTTISAGGYEFATITVVAKNQGKVAVGVSVEFETQSGSFSDSGELTSTTIATDAQGTATVQLHSPTTQGQSEVTATYYDDESGLEAVAKLTITFGPPQAGNLPVDGRFQLNCPYINLGALRTPKPDIVMDCQVSAQTTSGNVVPTESLTLFFLAEAGVMTAVDDPWEEKRVIRYSVSGGNPMPLDVPPVSGEPSRTGSLGEQRNPRDGVVTLLAIARGSEAWIDLNNNGVRDEGEPFTDTDEPFLDVDDDGVYTPGVDEYFDSNGDGSWTPKNGQYDGDTFIGAVTKVIWSGPIEEAPDAARIEAEPSSLDIPDSGSLILRVFLLDRNMNPVAAFGDAGDALEVEEQHGYVNVFPYSLTLEQMSSMEFDTGDPQWPILQFLTNAGKLNDITLYDASPNTDPPEENPFAANLSVLASPGPASGGYWVSQVTDYFSQNVQGTV